MSSSESPTLNEVPLDDDTILKTSDNLKEAEAATAVDAPAPDVYDKYSYKRKMFILAITSLAGLTGPIASSSFNPSIPQIASDIQTSSEVVDYTVAIFLFSLGVAPLIWAPAAQFYGRRFILLVSLPLFMAGCLGCALSKTLGALIGTRILQAIGSSSVLSIGAGIVGDIFRPTERATAMGWFYLGVVIGPCIAPVLAGILQEYTRPAWRSMQWLMFGIGALSFVLTLFFLPETSHGEVPHTKARRDKGRKYLPVMFWFNPFASIVLLMKPHIFLSSINSSFVLLTIYCVTVPLTSTLGKRYNISNGAIIGLLFLPQGFGNIVGSRVGGVLADKTVARWIKKRGYRRPEDRLYSTLLGGFLVLPGGLLATGWLMQTGAGGLAPPLVFLFILGVGLMLVLSSANTYLVDVLQKRSSEVIAVNNCVRYIFSAGASAGILPMINAIGVGWANTFAAGLSILGAIMVCCIIRWGEQWDGRNAPPPTMSDAEIRGINDGKEALVGQTEDDADLPPSDGVHEKKETV